MTKFYDPLTVRATVQHHIKTKQPKEFSQGHAGALIGHLNDELSQRTTEGADLTEINRRSVMMWLVTPDDMPLQRPEEWTSNDLQPWEWNAIKRWVNAVKVDETWMPRAHFGAEARWVLNCARFDLSRVTLSDRVLLMSDYVAFWKEHMPDPDSLGEMGISSLSVGGVPVDEDAPIFGRGEPTVPADALEMFAGAVQDELEAKVTETENKASFRDSKYSDDALAFL